MASLRVLPAAPEEYQRATLVSNVGGAKFDAMAVSLVDSASGTSIRSSACMRNRLSEWCHREGKTSKERCMKMHQTDVRLQASGKAAVPGGLVSLRLRAFVSRQGA